MNATGLLSIKRSLSDATITIRDKTITAYDKERKETFAAIYTLERKQTPWQITMISTKAPEVGVIAKGLINVHQNSVKLIYAIAEWPAVDGLQTRSPSANVQMVKIDQSTDISMLPRVADTEPLHKDPLFR